MGIKKIKEKISKLLNMAKKGTFHEREVAIIKARKMMLDNHIEEDEFLEDTKNEVVEIVCDVIKTNVLWRLHLANVICGSLRCKLLGSGGIGVIAGFKKDAEICEEMMKFAFEFADYHYKKSYQKLKDTYYCKNAKKSFMIGFADGIDKKFEEQNLEKEEYSLIVITPHEVLEHTQQYETKTLKSNPEINPAFFKKGFSKGKNFVENMNNKEIENGKEC